MIDSISHEITGDMVQIRDSFGAIPPVQAWQNQTALQTASALCDPFGIKVADEAGLTEVFDNFSSQPCETVAKVLVRLARLRGVWIGDDSPEALCVFLTMAKSLCPTSWI